MPAFADKDVVYIRIQPEVENGEIAAVRIDGEATLKRVYYNPGTLTLMPANPASAHHDLRRPPAGRGAH